MRDKTINEMIRDAGWFDGSERDWQAIPFEEREKIAFKACGCLGAYPTWQAPVNCRHIDCRVRRGEKQPIIITNQTMKAELRSGWLRFSKETKDGRVRVARLIRAIRRKAIETGIYDPWKIPGGWAGMVHCGIEG